MVAVQWTKKATKQLLSIDIRYRKAIKEKVDKLIAFPAVELDIKKLKATDSKYRMRVGDYRIIFQIENGEPVVCTIQEVKRRTSTTY